MGPGCRTSDCRGSSSVSPRRALMVSLMRWIFSTKNCANPWHSFEQSLSELIWSVFVRCRMLRIAVQRLRGSSAAVCIYGYCRNDLGSRRSPCWQLDMISGRQRSRRLCELIATVSPTCAVVVSHRRLPVTARCCRDELMRTASVAVVDNNGRGSCWWPCLVGWRTHQWRWLHQCTVQSAIHSLGSWPLQLTFFSNRNSYSISWQAGFDLDSVQVYVTMSWSDALCDDWTATCVTQLEPTRPTTRSSRLLTSGVLRVGDITSCRSPWASNNICRSTDTDVELSPLQLKSPHATNRSVSMMSPSLSSMSDRSS